MPHLDVDNLFSHHPPFGDQLERYQILTQAAIAYAKLIQELTPESPEQTLAIRKLQEAKMYANAAIAIHEKL